jgi:hypothetical protein
MRIFSFALKMMLLLMVPVLAFTSCKDDEPTPDTAKIHGTITIDNADLWATWKDSGEVQLTLFPEFVLALPPAGKGWGEIPDNFYGPGVPGGTYALSAPVNVLVINYSPGANQIQYELEVDPGTYSALALGLRHNTITDPSLRTATLGVHWGEPDTTSHGVVIKISAGGQIIPILNYPAPSAITVEKGDEVEINFRADFGFVETWFQ